MKRFMHLRDRHGAEAGGPAQAAVFAFALLVIVLIALLVIPLLGA